MARLLFFQGDQLLIDYKLRPGRTTIGRADSCDVALPGEHISRTHCIVDGQGESWEIADRSRHGTKVDGRAIRRAPLKDSSVLELGPYTVEFRLSDQQGHAAPTAEAQSERTHELVLCADESGLKVERAAIVVERGADAGRRFELKTSRLSVGAAPSTLELTDPAVVFDHCRLRVSRGRVMVEPGQGPVFLDGTRVRDVTPVYVGETVHLGQTVLRVELGQSEERPLASQFGDMVGETEVMRKLFGTLRRVSAHDFPVLLQGENLPLRKSRTPPAGPSSRRGAACPSASRPCRPRAGCAALRAAGSLSRRAR